MAPKVFRARPKSKLVVFAFHNVGAPHCFLFWAPRSPNPPLGAGSVSKNSIDNLSSYQLVDTEKLILAHGLEFCLPPTKINWEEIFAEFEVLIG